MIEPRTLDEISTELYTLSDTASLLSQICGARPESFTAEGGPPSVEIIKNAIYALSINLDKLAKEIDAKALADR